MTVYVWGLAGIVVFYIAMLAVGIWAGTKQKDQSEEEVMLAGRNIGTVVGVLTLIGLWLHLLPS
jgi:high affinity choline transporter 7